MHALRDRLRRLRLASMLLLAVEFWPPTEDDRPRFDEVPAAGDDSGDVWVASDDDVMVHDDLVTRVVPSW